MPERASERSLKIATALMAFFAYFGLTASYRYSYAVLIVPIVALLLMPFGEMLDRRSRWYQRVTTPITVAFGVMLFAITPRINLIDAVTLLVVYVQVFTLLHAKQARNYNHLLLMNFFLLLIACHLSPTPSIAVTLFVFILVGAWKLMSLEIFAAESEGVTASAIDSGLVGFARKGRDARGGDETGKLFDGRLATLTALSAFSVLGISSALFFFTPRMEAGLFGASESSNFTTGVTSEVDLSAGGLIEQDATAVMHVRFPEYANGQYPGELYWRIASLDTYTGNGWIRGRLSTNPQGLRTSERYRRFASSDVYDNGPGVDRRPFGGGTMVLQEIFLASPPDAGLPVLPVPKSVFPDEGRGRLQLRWDRAGDYAVVSTRTRESSLSYHAISEVFQHAPEELRGSADDFLAIIARNDLRTLTWENLTDETTALVERIVEDSPTVYDRVTAIERYFSGNGFVYSLNIPALPEVNPIDTFIHETKTGHCELYASAMALMVRSQGIPARVVSGYRGGEWNESDTSYTVTADMAHLWVEVFFPDFGWVEFDPSPSLVDENLTSVDRLSRLVSRFALRGKMMWYRNVVGFTPEMRLSFMKDTGLRVVRYGLNLPADDEGGRLFVGYSFSRLLVAPAVQFCAIAFAALMLFRAYRRVPKLDKSLSADQARAVRLYQALVQRMHDCGFDTRGKTIEEIRAEILAAPLAERERLAELLSACNAVRFGVRPLPVPLFKQLHGEVRGLRLSPLT